MRAGVAVATAVLAALGVVFLIIATTMPTPRLSVTQLYSERVRWIGRKVEVVGLLGQESSSAEHGPNQFYLSSWKVPDVHARGPFPRFIWIASDVTFESKAKALLGQQVVITARGNPGCPYGFICLGGADVTVVPGKSIELLRR